MPMVGVDDEVGANIKMNAIARVLKKNVEERKGTKQTLEIFLGVSTPMTCPVLCVTIPIQAGSPLQAFPGVNCCLCFYCMLCGKALL